MKTFFQSFYGKLSVIFLILLLIMGAVQIYITIQSSMNFVSEADQKLNLPLARNMALELNPFIEDTLDVERIKDKIHYMMVMNPKVEIYLLDGKGKILAFFADPPKKVKEEYVNLLPVQQFLDGKRDVLIMGSDPRFPGRYKPFTAAPLNIGRNRQGFIYIILGGEQYDSALSMLRDSYIAKTTIRGLLITVFFTGIIGLIIFFLLTRRLRRMTSVVGDFEQGNFYRRVPVTSTDELGQLGKTFNKMADTIVANMEELKRTDNLRRELVANVSHDLRSPLASIQGYLETIMMKDTDLSPNERQQYLETIFNNTRLLGRLVEELFELSRLDAKQIKPRKEEFPIAELVQDVVMKFRPRAEKSSITLQAVFPQDTPQVYGDIGLIERVVSNLIDNALSYTPSNGEVMVKLDSIEKTTRLTVSDTGYGIPEEDLPHIFDRFYRVEKSRGRSKGGTGLGLAIAKKIMELHDSDIRVESRVNAGTRFYFDLNAGGLSSGA